MKRAIGTGFLAGAIFAAFFVPTFILVFQGLAKKITTASIVNSQLFIPVVSNTVTIGGTHFTALISADPASRQLGLSYRSNLPANEVMLFVFPSASNWGIWMKGMNFPLDILWLNSAGRVIFLESNVSPNTYPETFAPPPGTPATFVIEMNAGVVATQGISVGSTIGVPTGVTASN